MNKLMLILISTLALSGLPISVFALPVIDSSQVYIAAVNHANDDEYVLLRNDGSDLKIDDLQLDFYNGSGNFAKSVKLSGGAFLANSYILIKKLDTARTNFDTTYKGNTLPQSGKLQLLINGEVITDVCWGSVQSCENHSSGMDGNKMLVSNCLLLADGSEESTTCHILLEKPLNSIEPNSGGWLADVMPVTDLEGDDNSDTSHGSIDDDNDELDLVTNSDCEKLQISEIGANLSEQFIEVANYDESEINLRGCILQTNRSKTKKFVFADEILESGKVRIVKIADTELVLSKTAKGSVYILSPDATEDLAVIDYPEQKAGTSWALIGGEWQQLDNPSPGVFNRLEVVNLCEGLRLSEVGANLDEQFIEIENPTAATVELNGCRLMTNRSTSKYFAFSDESLSPGAFKSVKVIDTDLTLTKTTKGTVYLLSSDGRNEISRAVYEDLAVDTSWALVDGTWSQTYAVTPGAANVYQQFATCAVGYYRNLETGRCNKETVGTELAACPTGQYRHPETNRCRKIATASASLTPCKAGYSRNPETNRCRKINTTSTELKPCAEGYERNPETNRCRKVVSSSAGTYPVNIDGMAGAGGIWTVAGIGVAALTALGVAFQYRMEIMNLIRKIPRPSLAGKV